MYKHMAESIKETDEKSFISSTERETYDNKAEVNHEHDSDYYTKTEIDNNLDVMYKTVEGTHIKSTSILGFTKDLEIYGNTKQRVEKIYSEPILEDGNINRNGVDIPSDIGYEFSRTGFIPVLYRDVIEYFNGDNYRGFNLHLYDKEKNHLRYDGTHSGKCEIADIEVGYIRFSHFKNDTDSINLSITRTHLDDIQSVGKKIGENNYQFDVVVRGNNLAKPCRLVNVTLQEPHIQQEPRYAMNEVIEIKPKTRYEFITKNVTHTKYCIWLDKDMNFISRSEYYENPNVTEGVNKVKCVNFTSPKNAKYVQLYIFDDRTILNRDTEMIENEWTFIEVEDVVLSTKTEPYESYKQTIELPVPLEGIEGKYKSIKDKLFINNKNHLCIEKRIGSQILSNTNSVKNTEASTALLSSFHIRGIESLATGYSDMIISSKFQTNNMENDDVIQLERCGVYVDGTEFWFKILKSRLSSDSVEGFNTWVSENNITVKYVLKTPEIIDLGPVENFNIRTLNGDIHILSDNTDVEPTIKCKLPNSIGSSLESNNQAIIELKNEINTINSLTSKGNTDIEIKDGVCAIPNTIKGQYINGLSISGQTILNLAIDSTNTVTSANATTIRTLPLQYGKTYTFLVYCKHNSTNKGFCPFRVNYADESWDGISKTVIKAGEYRTCIFKMHRNQPIKNVWVNWCSDFDSNVDNIVTEYVLLEGDYSDKLIPYFTGINSTSNEIVISSIGENLFKADNKYFINNENDDLQRVFNTITIKLPPGMYRYVYEDPGNTNSTLYGIYAYNYASLSTETLSAYSSNLYGEFEITEELSKNVFKIYANVRDSSVDIKNDVIRCKGIRFAIYKLPSEKTKFTEVEENSYTISFSEPLASIPHGVGDTIEYVNGRLCVVRRCGEVTLNGSETYFYWNYNVDGAQNNTYNVYTRDFIPAMMNISSNNTKIISDILPYDHESFIYRRQSSTTASMGAIHIAINKTELESESIEAVKAWLSRNNLTVIYELAEPIIEPLNMDLSIPVFDNHTTVYINSRSIPPVIKGSLTTNLSNTLSILMNKIEVLENQDTVMNRIKLRSTYESYKTSFGIDIQSLHMSRSFTEPDSDIFKLLYLVISEGTHNYDRYDIEEQIDFYTVIGILDYDMAEYLFNLIDLQHPVYEEEIL